MCLLSTPDIVRWRPSAPHFVRISHAPINSAQTPPPRPAPPRPTTATTTTTGGTEGDIKSLRNYRPTLRSSRAERYCGR